jgi:hypothetical protein
MMGSKPSNYTSSLQHLFFFLFSYVIFIIITIIC